MTYLTIKDGNMEDGEGFMSAVRDHGALFYVCLILLLVIAVMQVGGMLHWDEF